MSKASSRTQPQRRGSSVAASTSASPIPQSPLMQSVGDVDPDDDLMMMMMLNDPIPTVAAYSSSNQQGPLSGDAKFVSDLLLASGKDFETKNTRDRAEKSKKERRTPEDALGRVAITGEDSISSPVIDEK